MTDHLKGEEMAHSLRWTVLLVSLTACAGPPIAPRPTGVEIDDATARLDKLREMKLLERSDCMKQTAYVDARVFAEMTLTAKVGLGGSLMQACEMHPRTGSFTIHDHRNGKTLMTFQRGTYDVKLK